MFMALFDVVRRMKGYLILGMMFLKIWLLAWFKVFRNFMVCFGFSGTFCSCLCVFTRVLAKLSQLNLANLIYTIQSCHTVLKVLKTHWISKNRFLRPWKSIEFGQNVPQVLKNYWNSKWKRSECIKVILHQLPQAECAQDHDCDVILILTSSIIFRSWSQLHIVSYFEEEVGIWVYWFKHRTIACHKKLKHWDTDKNLLNRLSRCHPSTVS